MKINSDIFNSDLKYYAFLCEFNDKKDVWEAVIISKTRIDVKIKASERYGNVDVKIIKRYTCF